MKSCTLAHHWLLLLKLIRIFITIECNLLDQIRAAFRQGGCINEITVLYSQPAFFLKKIMGKATFIGALIAQASVGILFFFGQDIGSYIMGYEVQEIAYLWYNVIGCSLVIIFATIINPFDKTKA